MDIPNKKELSRSLERENASLFALFEIEINDFNRIFPNHTHNALDGGEVKEIEDSIKLYPLYGGGIDGDGKYSIVVAFKNDNMKLDFVQEDFDTKIKIRKRE